MSEKGCIHYFVSGRVQGVWFRASTQKEAQQLGLTGWTRNLPDGRVEVLACGERNQLEKLEAWLREGPPLAEVTEVIIEELPWEEHERFAVK